MRLGARRTNRPCFNDAFRSMVRLRRGSHHGTSQLSEVRSADLRYRYGVPALRLSDGAVLAARLAAPETTLGASAPPRAAVRRSGLFAPQDERGGHEAAQ